MVYFWGKELRIISAAESFTASDDYATKIFLISRSVQFETQHVE